MPRLHKPDSRPSAGRAVGRHSCVRPVPEQTSPGPCGHSNASKKGITHHNDLNDIIHIISKRVTWPHVIVITRLKWYFSYRLKKRVTWPHIIVFIISCSLPHVSVVDFEFCRSDAFIWILVWLKFLLKLSLFMASIFYFLWLSGYSPYSKGRLC